jgi:hypothetical protein
LAAVLREQRIDHSAHAENFLGMQIDIGRLTAQPGHPRW